MFDVVIIGGGAAGLSAALYLGRFRHKVAIFDTQKPANRFSHAAHGFFTRDGMKPSDLLAIGREQLQPYTTVQLYFDEVAQISPHQSGFEITLANGYAHSARKILLASGLKDTLPLIPGIEQFWGQSVFHCPYCDGWEQRDQPVAIIASGEKAVHVAKLLLALTSKLVICTNGEVQTHERDKLLSHGVQIIETPIQQIHGQTGQVEFIAFGDGSQIACRAIFVSTALSQHSNFANQLGCKTTENGLVVTDTMGRTSVSGVYAAGDMAQQVRQVVFAATQGASAAIGINTDLLAERF